MENNAEKGEVITSNMRDLAATLRKEYPQLPEIWEGGPSRNSAAKSMALRIQQDIKDGVELPTHKLEWIQVYSKALIRRRRTTIIEEEEEAIDISTQKDLLNYLLETVINSKRQVTLKEEELRKFYMDIIGKLEKEFRDYVAKQEERRDAQSMAIVEKISKENDKRLDVMERIFNKVIDKQQEIIGESTRQQTQLFTSSTAILTSSNALAEKYFKSLEEVIKKMEGGLLEDFVKVVLFPSAPAIIMILLSIAKKEAPPGMMDAINKSIQKYLTEED